MIREIRPEEFCLLTDFLYDAIFVPPGEIPPDKSIIDKPELRVYTENFGGMKDDKCLVAYADGEIAGAVWCRIMDDYGHVDDETPSLALSVKKEYRRRGIGTALVREMLGLLRRSGYARVSLSVQKANFAVNMYTSLGFRIFSGNDREYIMLAELGG